VFELLSDPEVWISFLTLTFLEIVLGIDNIIFLSILVSRLPRELQNKGRILGLAFAMITRIGLLFSLVWLIGLTTPWFTVLGEAISGRDLILFFGGLFLLVKSVNEIHGALEGAEQSHGGNVKLRANILSVAIQIGLIDIVFSLDSVLTAVGLANKVPVMVAAIVIAVIVMMFLARPIHEFIERHPTIKMLALSFLILIGVALIGESLEFHVPKGYLYFAMAFSVGVEMINIRLRKKTTPLDLRGPEFGPEDPPQVDPEEPPKREP
jgi:predicted tellurium resistance membrane protein TerC